MLLCKEFLIVQKEIANPTGLLNEIMQETLLPLQKSMQDAIRELIGPQAQNMQIQFCKISIISQCINPAVMRSNQKEMIGPSEITDIEKYADHVVQFSLAGIHKIQGEHRKKTFSRRNKVRKP